MRRISICLLFFVMFFTAKGEGVDYRWLKGVNHVDNRFVSSLSSGLSGSTPYLVVGVPAAIGVYSLIAKDEDRFFDALYIGTSVIEAFAISTGLKYAAHRKRPFERYSDIIQRESVDSPSFPSTHTSSAFALSTALSISYPKWYVIAPSMLWATGVGFSRLHRGVHYPSDVAIGAVIGAGSAYLNYLLNRWLIKKQGWRGKVLVN